jgi:hypothetical protein
MAEKDAASSKEIDNPVPRGEQIKIKVPPKKE